MSAYPKVDDAEYLLNGFTISFRIPVVGEMKGCFAKNLKLVQGMEDVVREKISKEVKEDPPITAPLGVVPKKPKGKYSLIHHLLYPEGDSDNDAIPQELCSGHYTPFDTAVCMIRPCGFGWIWLNVTLSWLSVSPPYTQRILISWAFISRGHSI